MTTAPVATKPVEPTGGLRQTREQILDGGDLDAGIALELDMGSSERASPEPASIRVAAAAAAPLARGPAPATPQLDPIEIRMVARFGATPDSWWATPSYVRLVRARQVELAKELTIAEQHYVAAKAALDDALVSIGQRAIAEVRNTVKGSRGSYLKTLDRLAKRETELKAIDTAVYEESEKHRDTMRTLFERIEATKTKLAASKGKDLTADLAALQQERDATERAMKMPTKSLDPEVERVRREFRATCADFAQFVLDDRANFSDDYEEPRARIARLRNAVDAEEKKVLLHDAASNAFDEKAMATGIRVMYGGIGLAVLSFVLLVLVLK